jgi:hypothetical protein
MKFLVALVGGWINMSEQLAVAHTAPLHRNLPGSAYAEDVIDEDLERVINFYVGSIDVRYDRLVAAGIAHTNHMDYLTLDVETTLVDRFCEQFGHINFWDVRQELFVDKKYLKPFESAKANFLANLALETKRWPSKPEAR